MDDKKEILQAAGKVCQNARIKLGVSQERMAKILGVNASTVSRFEHGMIDSLYLNARYQTAIGLLVVLNERRSANDET